MTTTSIRIAQARSANISVRRPSRALLIRFGLVAAAVVLCYAFQWHWLRYATSELNLRLDGAFGVHLQRISSNVVSWRGGIFYYAIACTMADVFCGAIPLLWSVWRRPVWNLSLLAGFALVLLCFNVARLTFSDVLFAAGIPWDLAHNVVSGVSYFLVWRWVWPHRAPEIGGKPFAWESPSKLQGEAGSSFREASF